MQTTILTILNVVIMMWMTFESLSNFKKILAWACYEAFAIVAETKGMPRQRIRKWCHGNISVPVAHGDTGAKEVWWERAKDGGVISVTEFPRVDGMATRRTMQATISDTVQTRDSSHSTCMQSFSDGLLGFIPSKRAFISGSVRRGSSHSRVVEGSSGSCT